MLYCHLYSIQGTHDNIINYEQKKKKYLYKTDRLLSTYTYYNIISTL